MTYTPGSLGHRAADFVNSTDRHIFLTGKAGTGKTTFLKYIVENTHKKCVVAAPTGIAAINAGGVTLHSLLQLPFGTFLPERVPPTDVNGQITTLFNLFSKLRFNAAKREMIQAMELLIIDEVSMLRADLLDCIDHMLRFLRKKKHLPFGGVQILFIGDLWQLPPVVKDAEWDLLSPYYESSYFFEAQALKSEPLIHIELDKVYRQTDEQFIGILNRFRENKQTENDVNFLNGYYQSDADRMVQKGYILLTTHNKKAHTLNQKQLEELPGDFEHFEAQLQGDFNENQYPTSPSLSLKIGAQVMFIKNDPGGEGRFYNGKLGSVSSLKPNEIIVQFEDGEEVEVPYYKWENKRYTLNKTTQEIEEKILGSFEQYPLKLAWAVTVHKSQGLTFEKAILDLSASFTHGQVYVALSRLTSLKGLILSTKLPNEGFEASASMKAFAMTKAKPEELEHKLKEDRKGFLHKTCLNAFDWKLMIKTFEVHLRGFDKQENRSLKQQYAKDTIQLFEQVKDLNEIAEKFTYQLEAIFQQQNDYLSTLNERLIKADTFFSPKLEACVKPIKERINKTSGQTGLKNYHTELKELEELVFDKLMTIQRLSALVNALYEGKELTRENVRPTTSFIQERKASSKKGKKSKTPTSEISYKLFQAGKSIEEIAEERGFVPTTIEGHLCQYVALGEIEASALMDAIKLENILQLITSETQPLGEIKAKLGDEYSFGEIKIAQAHLQRMKGKN